MSWSFDVASDRTQRPGDDDRQSRSPGRRNATVETTPVLFETLEPRVLLSGSPLTPPTGTILASDTAPAIVQDVDGTALSVRLTGAGHWQIREGANGPQLTVTATSAATGVVLGTSGDNGRFQLTGIDVEGAAQSIMAPTTDLTGSLVVKGPVSTVSLGQVKDTTASVAGAVGNFSVAGWASSGSAGNEIDATSINSLTSQGALNLSLNLSGSANPGLTLGSVSAAGALGGGQWQIAGRTGVIAAASVAPGWTGDFSGSVREISTTGDFDGTVSAPSLQDLSVGGNLSQAHLYIGADPASENVITYGPGVLGYLRVGGSVTGSRVYVGVNPQDGIYDNGNDVIAGGIASQIQEIAIGGTIDATSRIEAGALPPTVRLDGATITPSNNSAAFGTKPIGSVATTITAALADDTGASKTDGITSDPTISGKLTVAGGIAAFRGGLDSTPSSGFTNLLPAVLSDGSFTLTAALLTQMAGGSLADGAHTLHLIATDQSGNISTFNLTFTLDTAAPSLTAQLADDTGTRASDSLTSDDTVAGKLSRATGLTSFTAAIDAGTAASIAMPLQPDGSFILSPALLSQLAGGALADGAHTLHLVGTDIAGNQRALDLGFTLDTTAPSLAAALADDTGSSATDGVTSDDTMAGRATDTNGIAGLAGALDAGAAASLSAALKADGSFTITPAMIAQLAGGTIADGQHTLHLIATDNAGNATAHDVTFTLETVAPAQPVFDLAAASDTGTVGDHTTADSPVTLVGTTEANATVTLAGTGLTTTADANGSFQFSNIALTLGANSFTAQASDAAGNTSTYQLSITLVPAATPDTTPPTLTAVLADDTGISATDGITSDPSISGTLVDNAGGSGVATFTGGLDAASPTNLIAHLNSDGTFTLSAALMKTLAGGTLADGAHTLHLAATDHAGNSTTLDVAFTLQTAAPAISSFALAQSSQTDASDPSVTADGVVNLTGVATAGATITLGTITALAGDGGVFQITNVSLVEGLNTLTITATSPSGVTAQASLMVTRQGTVGTDAALTWNMMTLDTISGLAMYPPDASRLLAIVSLAQYDTLAAIEGTPAYLVKASVTGPVSEQAALSQTAYEVLLDLFPALKSSYDAVLATSLAGIPTGAALTNGIALGKSVADTIVALRQNDGSANFVEYDGGTQPGQWAPTAPNNQPAIDPQWGSVTPFAIASADALLQQLGPPPALSTSQWATDLNQVESLGASNSTTRTADETQIALFWAGSTGTVTPSGLWNIIAQTVAQQQGNSLSANVRMFAMLNTALADASIADWDVKYTYGTWRPIQAVQDANAVNPAATSDPGWTPLLITPAFPEYAAGHATYSMAAAVVLDSIFGTNVGFSFSVPYLPGVTRSFTNFDAAATEAGMSRIYGGIHFMFSVTAGWQLGTLVANEVLARFALSQDTTPPVVIEAATPAVTDTNLTLTGQVVDNLSGVKSATISVDGGTAVALTLDAMGNFSFTTTYVLDGTADGSHTVSIAATDNAGNVAQPHTRTYILDTLAPTISLTSLSNGDALTSTSTLTGVVDGTGSTIVALHYIVDGGVVNPISFDPTTGDFTQALPVANLTIGSHTVVLTAQDAAGNTATLTRTVSVTQMAAFTISSITPSDGSTDVGVTQRPRIDFTRAVNTSTLTAMSFYATDSAGNVITTTIAPSQDGSYAFLLFNSPMPGSSTVTLTVVGSLIRAAADGAFLDAAGTGATAGSTLTESFTTVSTTGVSGTTIEGIVADPGPDDVPMTFDDVGRGPDGLLNTADDIYKLPIAGVTVTILGTTLSAVTDSKGFFQINDAPAGDVKLVLDGTTATNPPAGYYFPTMTLDLTVTAGAVNTPMGSMGTTAEMAANAGVLGTYLPRVMSSVLTTVSTTQPTTITTTTAASPTLSASQVGELSLTIQPGSALDANGNPVTNFQVGIAAVPPQIVQDMLPAGVTQHTYDITIQAPGVAVFTAPATLTFPNVFNAAPGTQLQVLSFDHTTGRLVIDGYATMSADGKTVTSNPGQGVTAPGWHGLLPPGTMNNNPCPPVSMVPPTVNVPPVCVTAGLQNYYFYQDNKNFTLSFGNAATPINPSQNPCSTTNMQATPLDVNLTVEGTSAQFLQGLASNSFTLLPGQQNSIQVNLQSLLTAANISAATADTLYGCKVHIEAYQDGMPGTLLLNKDIYIYRLFDVSDDNHSDGQLNLPKDLDIGGQTQAIPLQLVGAAGTMLTGGGMFAYDSGAGNVTFTATAAGLQNGNLQIMTPAGDNAGNVACVATGVNPQNVDFAKSAFTAAVKAAVDGGLVLIAQARIDSAGMGYAAGTYNLGIVGGGGAGAAGTYTVDATGKVTGISITATGAGYTTVPTLTFPSGGGMGAAGTIGSNAQFLSLFSPAPGPGQKRSDAADFQTNVDKLYADAKAGIAADFASVPGLPAAAINVQDSTAAPGNVITWGNALTGPAAFAQWADFGGQTFQQVVAAATQTSVLQREFDFSNLTNREPSDSVTYNLNLIAADDYAFGAFTLDQFGAQLGNIMTHEVAHDLGAIHERDATTAYAWGSVMGYNANNFTAASFGMHFNALIDDGLGEPVPSLAAFMTTYNYYVTYVPLEDFNIAGTPTSYAFNEAAYPGGANFPSLPVVQPPGHGQNQTDPVYPLGAVFAAPLDATTAPTAVSNLDFGTSLIGAKASNTVYLVSTGNEPLDIQAISIKGDSSAFSVSGFVAGPLRLSEVGDNPGTPSLSTLAITVTYNSAVAGSDAATLSIISNSVGGEIDIPLTGTTLADNGVVQAYAANDNTGGADIGESTTVANFGTVTNTGGGNLVITGARSTVPEFAVTGLSTDNPITLAPGQSVTYGVTFTPSSTGLLRGKIEFTTNDPTNPIISQAVVGTGTQPNASNLVFAHDYVAVDFPANPSLAPLRAISDSMGSFQFVLPTQTPIHYVIFDPVSGLVATGYTLTASAGQITNIPGLVFKASTANDSNGDGIPDDIKFAIGASTVKSDSNGDGIDDFTALKLGLNPVAGVGFPTGIVSAANLNGTAQAVAVAASTAGSGALTAYVATGSSGLAVVDVTNSSQPNVLAQLSLEGDNVAVAVDTTTQTAVVAGSDAGLHIVDISTPSTPSLLADIAFPNPVVSVAVNDGVAYVAEGTAVAVVDLTTDTVLTTLDLSADGGTTLTDLALSGTTLLTMDAANTLRAITITGDVLTVRGSLTLSAGDGNITIGGNVAYVPAANGNASGGYQTVDISNPDSLKLIEGIDLNSEAGAAMALNGSGLAVAIQSLQQPPPNPGVRNDLDVVDVSDPTKTGQFVTRIMLPQAAYGLTIANGLAFVADGSGGLQIVNYVGIDTNGVPPAVAINVSAADVDPNTPGVQVVEGSVVQVTPAVTDDVQVRNVELLVNGQVVANDPSYPFNFCVQAPTIASGGTTMTIQVLAFDTGGNSTLSNLITLDVVKDTFPPVVAATSIAENASLYYVKSIQITFNKPLNTSLLAASGVSLVGAGSDGVFGTADDTTVPVTLSTRSFGQVLTILLSSALPSGSFKLTINPSIIADLSGNVLTSPITLDFSIRPASDVNAASGVPAIIQEPSANPGQLIGIAVSFDPSTAHMVFPTINASGTVSTADVAATQYDKSSGTAYFIVPSEAMTGNVNVYSLVNGVKTSYSADAFPIEIVPIVTGITVNSVSLDGTSAQVTLTGSGFIEGNGSSYQFGTTAVVDNSASNGPDVQDVYTGVYPNYYNFNSQVVLTVPLSAGAFGPITVATTGGTSVPFGVNLTGVIGAALSGTPANASVASANPGQAVTLTGTGLSTSTGVMLTYTSSNGTPTTVLLHPASASPDGTQASLIVPLYANGVVTLSVLGVSSRPVLQIVPVISSYSDNGSTLALTGSGFVEGASSYQLPGVVVTDTSVNSGPDVYQNYNQALGQYIDNGGVNIPEPAHGLGSLTVTTAGGTSAPLALNEFTPAVGTLGDLAVDPSSGLVWVSEYNNPTKLDLVDPTTGAVTRSLTLTNAFGTQYLYSYAGLDVLGSAMTLGSTSVPAGSLLVFNGYASQVTAINATTGAVLASLSLTGVSYPTAGTYDPASGHLFVIAQVNGAWRAVEINPKTAAVVASFALPFTPSSNAGLAIDPTTGDLWYGSDESTEVVELTRAGAEVRRVGLQLQGETSADVSGLSFDAAGDLLVSTTQGTVYRISLGYDPAVSKPTLSAITAPAQGGTPASTALASANAGQVITLTGSDFGPGTEVVFPTLESSGNPGQTAVTPLAISADGTTLQVQVPTLATTGAVQVVNVGSQNLGYSSYNDAIYRGVTVSFTPTASGMAALTFADDGLQGLSDESWGIDNVLVAQGGSTVFADDFESGSAKPQWSVATVDAADLGVFSRFLGRFSSGSSTLNLTGLTPGQSYTLTFDLYILDSWDGTSTSGGPDYFQVSANGATLLKAAFTNFTYDVQTYNASAGVALQIVPTLSGMTGAPGSDAAFDLLGSGFMDGASTVTIGGVKLVDGTTNQSGFGVTGTANADLHLSAPLTLDGPIKVTTAGGSAQISGPVYAAQPPVQFTGIATAAQSGTPADATKASANVGQTITLTGQGFTSSTLMQFSAVDATGAVGTVTRTGTASADGTSLTLLVPELARTGLVRVLGSSAAYTLQVVPLLRSVGGTLASGNTIELEGTGLVASELVIRIDGQAVGTFRVRNVLDDNPGSVNNPINGQQLLTLTVPAGIGAGVITVSTNGGTLTLHPAATFSASTLTPTADVGDTLATAQVLTLPSDSQVTVTATIGDGANAALDVDLYQVTLAAGEVLSVGLNASSYSELRIFNAAGTQLATQNGSYVSPGTTGLVAQFTAPSAGTYYVGVSGYNNTSYDPTKAASGTSAYYTGSYTLLLQRLGAADTRLSAITATAASGTAANTGVASANIGQTITLTGSGLLASDQVVFTAIDASGNLYADTVNPLAVATNGTSLTVVVPTDATTGTVRLARDTAGILLQVVPTLSHVDVAVGGAFTGGAMTLTGSGFAEGVSAVQFGAQTLADTSRSSGLDVASAYVNGAYTANAQISLTTPNGVPTGPIYVTTPGGSSAVYPLTVTGLTATATAGTPANAGQASANAGQAITLQGTGLDTTTDVVFQIINSSGAQSQIIVHPTLATKDGTSATVVVPTNAITGYVRVVGDENATQTLLQIVPV